VIGLKEVSNPLNLFPIGFFLWNLLRQIGQADQIFLGGIGQKRKSTGCKFFYGVTLGPLIKIHCFPHHNKLRRKSLQTNHVSITGLKWLKPVPSTSGILIGTDNTLKPFLQALIRSSNSVSNPVVERSTSFKTFLRMSRNPDWLSVISEWQSRETALAPRRFQNRRRKVILPNSAAREAIRVSGSIL